MKPKFVIITATLLFVSSCCLFLAINNVNVRAQGNHDPELSEGFAYAYDTDVWFDVTYIDVDGDVGEVFVYVDQVQIQMYSYEGTPSEGWCFEIDVAETEVTDQTEFYFYADDNNGSTTYLYDVGGVPFVLGDFLAGPILSNPSVYLDGNNVIFEVTYRSDDGTPGDTYLNFDWGWYDMITLDSNPSAGQRYSISYPKVELEHNTWFYFDAWDDKYRVSFLPEDYSDFVISQFISLSEWGYDPVLSNPDVDLVDDNIVFYVTYQDSDGDSGTVQVNFGINYYDMQTTDLDPVTGQRYSVSFPKSSYTLETSFYFEAIDTRAGNTIYNNSGTNFLVSDFITEEQWQAKDKGDDGTGFDLGAWFGNPEVVIGLVALLAMAGGSAYGVYRRKKKRGRFSELLSNLDDIYRSYKLNPHKCEIELEKMRAVINEELKHSVIDENNYSILKERIDELVTEIRSDTLQAQVSNLPKDIELRIKDMLIDGKISREEYDKLLPIITGSDMAADDKEKMQKVIEGWVKEDKKLDK